LRVLHPNARAIRGADTLHKPQPAGTDDWSHPYHGPDNNPQSKDRLAKAPFLTQFLSQPWYVPMPQVTVTSGGRIFKAFGHIAMKQREWPWLNTLLALNAYNGTQLWQLLEQLGVRPRNRDPNIKQPSASHHCVMLHTRCRRPSALAALPDR
jgi:hypothetical protein